MVLRTLSDLQGQSLELRWGEPGSGPCLAAWSCVTLGLSFLILKRTDGDLMRSQVPRGSRFWESE